MTIGKNKIYRMWYQSPAPERYDLLDFTSKRDIANDGWEKWSLPIGNGFMGICTFGRTTTERLQITESSLFNPPIGAGGGLSSFAELFLDLGHKKVSNYHRDLILNHGISSVDYDYNDVSYHRECFVSYPDRVFVMKLSASVKGALSFTARPVIPFVRKGCMTPDDGCGREGQVTANGNRILLEGRLVAYDLKYEGIIDVLQDGGTLKTDEESGRITVTGADSAVILMTAGTSYKLCAKSFLESENLKKLEGNPHPHQQLAEIMEKANCYTYEQLLERHLDDFHEYFDRVIFDLGSVEPSIPTDRLITNYHYRDHNKYLEELAFHYGRYLLISSGRPDSLPVALSGVWNRGAGSNCAGGYFHDINLQMNYWAAFTMNLSEMFEGYVAFNREYLPEAKRVADEYIARWFPEKLEADGQNGWIVGTSLTPFFVDSITFRDLPVGQSGPGQGGMTALLFWDYYEYTQDREILQNIVFPLLSSMSHFLSKLVEEYDDKLLIKYSASPEQIAYEYMTTEGPAPKCRPFPFGYATDYSNPENLGYASLGHVRTFYDTTGCSFDQQMIFETYAATIRAAEILGIDNEIVRTAREQIGRLDPTPIGASGQIKEFREEDEYGDIGDPNHRHISHLHGLLPGTHCFDTEEKLRAAEVALTMRGRDEDMDGGLLYGFALAFRLCLWAKVRNGSGAYRTLNTLLGKISYPNLMVRHWEVDTNIGTTYGIGDMLVQSRWGNIEILPALPKSWDHGKIQGILARGNFSVDLAWENHAPTTATIRSNAGMPCRIKFPAPMRILKDGQEIFAVYENDVCSFPTEKGAEYLILF